MIWARPNIIEEIKRVFDGNDNGEIMLSTVHKAKGLEANNVYLFLQDCLKKVRLAER